MNKNQKIVAITYVIILLAIVTYIPFVVGSRDAGNFRTGYEFIFELSYRALPNVPMLFFEFLAAGVIASVLYFVLKDK